MSAVTTETEAYRYIMALVYERCRIRLHDGKEALIRARLGKLLRRHSLVSLPEYCDYLRNRADEREFTRVVDALTTNFTHFLREADHFQFVVEQALPSLLSQRQKHFNIWSAASSSGEEAYSLAFYLSESYPPVAGWDWRILASDISTRVLEQARRGIYPADRVRAVPPEWLRRYFQQGVDDWAGLYRVKRSVAERVLFRQINLIGHFAHPQSFETILCRNVMIYFDRATQEQLVEKLCGFLVPGGYLIIGHSESLNGLRIPLKCLRPSIYRKI
jgi:chemotaxis protein methyltransferase CheR